MHELPYPHFTADAMPQRANSGAGRWRWLRDFIINDLTPDGKPEYFIVPNQKEAEAMRSAAQNTASVKDRGSRANKLCWPLKVSTASLPVSDKNGKYKVFIRVFTP